MKIIKEDVLVLLSIGSFVVANVGSLQRKTRRDDGEFRGSK